MLQRAGALGASRSFLSAAHPMSDLVLIPIAGGALCLTHRPKLKSIPAMPATGVTHVVTLLAESEGARQIGDAVLAGGMDWIWSPMAGASVPDAERTAVLRRCLGEVCGVISAGGHVVVHCSAGIHRTGMFGHALLRLLGLDATAARAKLGELRQVTGEGVGELRTAWGDALALGSIGVGAD